MGKRRFESGCEGIVFNQGGGTIMTDKYLEAGRVAFAAYRECVGGVAYDGTPIPKWEELKPGIKSAWQCAGLAAAHVATIHLRDLVFSASNTSYNAFLTAKLESVSGMQKEVMEALGKTVE